METKQYEGKTLKYLIIEPDGYDSDKSYPAVILLHGFGASMADLAGLCPVIDRKGYLYVCPNAPIPVQIGPGMTGFAWTPPGESRTPDDMERAVEMLAALVQEVTAKYRVELGQAILGGFSQGGMMTYSYGLPHPELFQGLLVLNSSLPYPDTLRERLPASRNQPIFVSHGTADPLISVEDGQRSREFLESEGYRPEYREYGMGHEISQDVMDDLVPWVHKVLPPLRVRP